MIGKDQPLRIDNRVMTTRWCKHLLGCQRKGKEAFLRGDSRDSCPYVIHNHYDTGPKNLLKQRKSYWQYGWDMAAKEAAIEEEE